MTTIAYKDGVLAADSMVSDEDIKHIGLPKLFRIPGGRVGFAGTYVHTGAFVRWLEAGRPADALPPVGDTCALVVWDQGEYAGQLWYYDDSLEALVWPLSGPFAFGSGAAAALGAMYAGADAATAVEIATRIDPRSGGGVSILQPL